MKQLRTMLLWFCALLFVAANAQAQNATLSGTLTDENKEGLIGASILIVGTSLGTVTDFEGNFTITEIPPGTYPVKFSYIGYKPKTDTITLTAGATKTISKALDADVLMLNEAVVVGYGAISSGDLTGSTKVVKDEDFAQGNITTPEQLITGKVSGVQITSYGGAPGAGSQIRIRGGSSLSASNDPLIVIDGIPVDNGGISGASNPLTLINPNDIESMVVLKDASAAAIYGSRGANGVIIITTKTGADGGVLKVTAQQATSVATVAGLVNVLDADQLRAAVEEFGTENQLALLGDANTNWQEEIYQNALISETNVSLTGGVKGLPYRLSLGYKHEDGLLMRNFMNRSSVGLNMNPKFLNDKLQVSVNTKFTSTENSFSDQGAIVNAILFDPTQSVLSGNDEYNGYFEWLRGNGNPNTLSQRNPVGLINSRNDLSNVTRILGNIKLDYELPFLPGFHAVVNAGGDYAEGSGTVTVDQNAASAFNANSASGSFSQYEQSKQNRLLETYFNYGKDIPGLLSRIDLTGGYSYQRWKVESPSFAVLTNDDRFDAQDTLNPIGIPFFTENALISFFGRFNYSVNDKYLITATLRRDGSSRFSPESRWGTFPSAAVAWKVSEERFLKDSRTFNYLKVRAGYGITGQQDVGSDYAYQANYQSSTLTAQYQFGNRFYNLLRPDGFDYNLKWEETASSNVGLDYGLFNNRIFGALDFYVKNTTDLLAVIDVPAGANFKNEILTNVGSLTNRGVEFELNVVAISTAKTELILGANATANRNEITKLTKVPDPNQVGILTGGVFGGIGNNVQIHAVGHSVSSFYVYEQVYEDGKPVEGEFVDRNGDGTVNESDRYIAEKPIPDLYAAFFGNLKHGNWSLAFALRGEFGKYIYSNVNSALGYYNAIPAENSINNLNPSFLESGFIESPVEQILSDHWIEKANFVRMDYITLGYEFDKVFHDKSKLLVGFTVNNAFLISPFSGMDPEIASGIDLNIYPRPRIFAVNLTLTL